jgi:hypothetical protein
MLENMSPHCKRAGAFLLAAMVLASLYLLGSTVFELFTGL